MYVGNLPFSAGEEELREAFGAFGPVSEVNLVMDRETGRPRRFARGSGCDGRRTPALTSDPRDR